MDKILTKEEFIDKCISDLDSIYPLPKNPDDNLSNYSRRSAFLAGVKYAKQYAQQFERPDRFPALEISTAIGLLEGTIKGMKAFENFNKEGALESLEEVKTILEKYSPDNDSGQRWKFTDDQLREMLYSYDRLMWDEKESGNTVEQSTSKFISELKSNK